jgi:hypothetical protein
VIWDRILTETVRDTSDLQPDQLPIVLVIGDIQDMIERDNIVASDRKMLHVDFHDITPEMIMAIGPHMIISPLLAMKFDCIDLACVLQEAGFQGQYRALSRKIPNPKLVRREIHSICPEVDFDMIMVDDPADSSVYH